MGRRSWTRPVWLLNPVDGGILFLLEALIVLVLAACSFGVAVLALWAF
jgi:hypothetical protein